jgi:hypothetical protein
MIELLDDRFGGLLDVAIVDQIALFGVNIAFDDDVEAEGVAMEPAALVAVGKVGRSCAASKWKVFDSLTRMGCARF